MMMSSLILCHPCCCYGSKQFLICLQIYVFLLYIYIHTYYILCHYNFILISDLFILSHPLHPQRHCLWMVRMGKTDIARLHDVDLSNRYNTSAQLLDVVELAAIMASLPERFSNDPMGKKMAWKTQLENQLKQAMADRDAGTLPKNKLRAPVYTTAKGPYTDLSTVREIDAVVKADVVNRKSFTEVCGAHSILAKKKKRPKSVVVDSAAHAKLLSDMSMQDAMNSRGSM